MSKKPLVSNSADPEQVSAASAREEVHAESERDDLKAVLATAEGRRVLRRIVAFTGVFRTSFTGNSETFFREGARTVGLKILADTRLAAPDRYMDLVE